MRQNGRNLGPLDHYLVGPFSETKMKRKKGRSTKGSRFLALHLRFEIDMVAHSLCDFGGGDKERRELESYREIHFPALTQLKKTAKYASFSSVYNTDVYVVEDVLTTSLINENDGCETSAVNMWTFVRVFSLIPTKASCPGENLVAGLIYDPHFLCF